MKLKIYLLFVAFCGVSLVRAQHVLNFNIPACPWVSVNHSDLHEEIIVFPNPATHNLYVEFANINNQKLKKVEIFNIYAQIVYDKEFFEKKIMGFNVDIAYLKSGVYFIVIHFEESIYRKQFIVH